MKKFIVYTLSSLLSLMPVALSAQEYMAAANTPAHIRLAVESAQRSMEDTQRDPVRKPAELLTLAELNSGDHIIELSALGQYYSNILAAAVGPTGQVDMYDLPPWRRFGAAENGEAFAAAHSNATYNMVSYDEASYADQVDAVYNILSYHDLPSTGVNTAAMNNRLYATLKPGGLYVIVDHRAEDGSGWQNAGLHRVDIETIIDEVNAAGFELITNSALLANPADNKSTSAFEAAGNTDRAVLIFQKPL